jgi:hypothetical protein
MLTPGFARRDLERAATPAGLARGRELAGQVEELLLHHGERPLAG